MLVAMELYGSCDKSAVAFVLVLIGLLCHDARAIRLSESLAEGTTTPSSALRQKPRLTAVFAMGSFWRGEAVFGCIPGVFYTRVGYCGGTKVNPDYHNIGDHAECLEVEYDPTTVRYENLLDVFWTNHDPTEEFGQGPDVGDQYRSVIFVRDLNQHYLANLSKEREQLKLGKVPLLTQVQTLTTFYLAESEHQKFELRRYPLLLQLLGDLSDVDITQSATATKLNSYAARLCPKSVREVLDKHVDSLLKSRPKLQQLFGD